MFPLLTPTIATFRKSIAATAFLMGLTFAVTSTAFAEQAQPVATDIGGKSINLLVPENMCKMNPAHPADKRMIDASAAGIKGKNELLLSAVECTELKNWRTGKQRFLDNFGSYQVSLKLKNVDLTAQKSAILHQVCDVFKKQGAKLLDTIRPDVNKRLQTSLENVQVNQVNMLGILHDTDEICAIATHQRIRTEDGTEKDQLSIYSITVVKGRMIYSYLFSPQGTKNLNKLSNQILSLHEANQQANNEKN